MGMMDAVAADSDSEAESMDGAVGTDEHYSVQPSGSSVHSELNLSNLGLENIPVHYMTSKGAFDVSRVRSLLFGHNQLLTVPQELGRFSSLVTLDLSNNTLTELSTAIGHLDKLKVLQLTNNQLDSDSFPKTLHHLKELEVLNVGGNRIEQFPPSVLELPQLKALYMGANRLHELPNRIGAMLSLEILYLGGNRLREIPATIGKLVNLSSLVLCDNHLETIPPTIADLQRLESLSLHNNKLTTLPTDLCKLRNLHQLSLRSNPLVAQFVRDITLDPPTLKELSARVVKLKNWSSSLSGILPRTLVSYLASANQCVNPKCKGVYFEACVEHVKFVDFCGKYRVPLMQYLCSARCSTSPAYAITSDGSDSEDSAALPGVSKKMKKVLLG